MRPISSRECKMVTCSTTTKPVVRATAHGSVAAFTLVEVILAIGIATGLLLLVLTFYQQAAEMRRQVLREAEQVSTMRLLMDRLAADLRAVQPGSRAQFTGGSNAMSFVKIAWTSLAPHAPSGARDPTDLVRVSLTTLFATNENQIKVSGLDRNESALDHPIASTSFTPTEPVDSLFSSVASDEFSVNPSNQSQVVMEPFADIVRFVRFRYWDGMAWQFNWTNSTPPPGVEIVLSTMAASEEEDAEPDGYPPEAFRRVVFVPAGIPRSTPDTSGATNSIARSE